MDESRSDGLPIRVDPAAESASQSLPAFLSRPEGAPAYHGFQLTEIEVDGFKLGAISDYVGEGYGDGFVVAPDGSRAGLVWQVASEEVFSEACPPDEARWGVWEVSFPAVMRSEEDVRRSFNAVVPRLREKWDAWRDR